ncbi:hypothetical protein [Paenibacillus thermotolerans]|uniref:hypothetical protein n=1 Tax=Paenibacillus thermotolerans TaxID=3027807 RepID=UPI00236853E2|nr:MULTISPECIES: hypothetical protein [unclassified Paenibacillus]
MNGEKQGEVILFPKTLDYYQIQLTKMLETERYGDAIMLLKFLLDCKTGDPRAEKEWGTLLEWLRVQFPGAEDLTPEQNKPIAEDDAGEAEEDMVRRTVSAKASNDKMYINRLLGAINHASVDKQMLALDQLAYVEDADIAEQLLQKLHSSQLHPFVAFKLLQTLCKLGAQGETSFGKLGEIVTVDIEKTPLFFDQFPSPLPEVSDRVQHTAEVNDPTLSYFAQQTWREYLTYCYGNAIYQEMVRMPEEQIDVWAAALHAAVAESMYGEDAAAAEAADLYGITERLIPYWQRACRHLKLFFKDGVGTTV